MDTTEGPKVIERADGFFGVEGQPDTVYYSSRAIAERVAHTLGQAQAEEAEQSAAAADDHNCETG